MALLELENKVSFSFEKLFIPSYELQECEIELVYNKKSYRLKYPVVDPTIIILDNIFTKDNRILLYILLRESKTKLRKIAVGKINLYKKYFLAKTYNIDKWIYLDLNANALNLDPTTAATSAPNSEILNAMTATGKIFMKASLLNPPAEDNKIFATKYEPSVATTKTGASIYSIALKNNLKNLDNTKTKVMANKTEKFRSITEHTNEFLRKLKNNQFNSLWENDIIDEECPDDNKYNDGLSDVTVTVIDGAEENHVEVEKMNFEIEETITQIKEVFESKPEELIPQQVAECKTFIKDMVDQINSLQQNYNTNLTTLAEINKRIKFQAKNYYERYKELKHQFKKERDDYNVKNQILEHEVKANIAENTKLQNVYSDLKNEMLFFRSKAGIKIDSDQCKDEEIIAMADVLNSLKGENDIFQGLNEIEKENLKKVLTKYEAPSAKENKTIVTEENVPKIEQNNSQQNEQQVDIDRDSFNRLLAEAIENFKRVNNIKTPITFNQVKDDKYDLAGKSVTIVQQSGVFKVFDANKFVSLNEFLFKNISTQEKTPSTKKPVSNSKKTAGYQSNPISNSVKNHMDSLLDKKLALAGKK